MKKKTWILCLAVAVALVALLLYARSRINFNWAVFVQQLRLADWRMMGLGVVFIWLGYVVRATRWALFLKPMRRIPFPSRAWRDVLAAQVIGFTGVALLGRPADLVRPYLVSRRLRIPLSAQVAVYVVERMFDAAAVALIFSGVLFFAPDRTAASHPELLRHFAVVGLLAVAFVVTLAVTIHLRGEMVAAVFRTLLGLISEPLGASAAKKILAFREGLDMLASARDVAWAFAQSLFMWGLITGAYFETIRAFSDSPPLRTVTLAGCLVLMAIGMATSMVQLPIIGWFTQIAVLAAALQGLFHADWEPALGCGAMLLVVTFLSVLPLGLIWARFDRVSLRSISKESESAGEPAVPAPAPALTTHR